VGIAVHSGGGKKLQNVPKVVKHFSGLMANPRFKLAAILEFCSGGLLSASIARLGSVPIPVENLKAYSPEKLEQKPGIS
jgi:hypothetical protein